MSGTRKLAAALALGVATATLGGATALQASSAQEGAEVRTTRFVAQTFAETVVGDYRFVGADKLRRSGEIIGYNSYTGSYFPKRDRLVIRVGLALAGGVIMGRVAATGPEEDEAIVLRGPILSGSGRYAGIRGRIVARIPAGDTEGRAYVTLRWTT